MTSENHRQALSDFLASTEKRAYRMAQLATGDGDEALDIVQDAMLKLVKHYSQKAPEQWRPLFYRILHNRIQDHHRRHKIRRAVFGWLGQERDDHDALPDPLDNAPAAGPDAADQLKSARAMGVMERAIRQLPARQQQALMLRLWEGMDVAETATAMACSPGSVKTHYARAIAKLRETLGDHWP